MPKMLRKADPKSLKPHPLAHLIPDMRPSEWQDFYNDIAMKGIKVPLEVLADGTVLDGRHRLRAAIALGMKEVLIVDAPLNGDSPEAYMLKAAILRRHLNDDQRAAIARLWIKANKQERDTGGKFQPLPPRGGNGKAPETHSKAQELFKVGQKKLDQATYVERHNPGLFEKVHQGEIALSNAYRQAKAPEERQKIETTKPPEGTYQVIVVDPPWPFTSRCNDPTRQGMIPYESMSIEAIKTLKIPAADNSILWLWVPNAFLHDAFHVLEAWGFKYRTTLTWAKNFGGLGDWLAGQTEHCLLATRGNYGIFRKNESTLLTARKTKHSEKPESFYELVERLCPGTKIDMFARRKREAWSYWGAEVNE